MTLGCIDELRELLRCRSGLDLGRGGMEASLERFVGERLDATGLPLALYLEALRTPGSEELRRLLEAMTVVYTWFFRDPGQFAMLERVLPTIDPSRPASIWVAGCATGEEPYSVALVAARLGRVVDILGTDLNGEALLRAREGRYSAASLGAVDPVFRDRYLGSQSGDYVVPDAVKRSVRFELRNLLDPAPRAPSAAGWDIVICRNVLIYFGRKQARKTLDGLAGALAPGGFLVVGASEGILEKPAALETTSVAGRAVLRRPSSESLQAQRARGGGVIATPPFPTSVPWVAEQSSAHGPRSGVPTQGPHAVKQAAGATPRKILDHGHAALDAGDILAARRSYLHALELDPTCAEALMFNGITHFLDGNMAEALHHLRGALCLDATLWAACFYQALCYENQGHAEDAARAYAQVLWLAEKHAEPRDGHAILSAWRSDLLNVARRRAHLGRDVARAVPSSGA